MKALVKKEASKGLWLEEVPIPEIGPNDVLIKIHKTAICGTDVHIYKWDEWAQKTIPVPLIIGHEFMGTIAAVGKDVQHLQDGMRVTGEGHITCGECPGCRHGKKHLCSHTQGIGVQCPGCFAEYFSFPASNVFALPDNIPDEIAAIFDPFGNAVHTAYQLQLPAHSVLVTGGGPIGIMAAAVAHFSGANHVILTDINPWRLELGKKMGATETIDIRNKSIKEYLKEKGLSEEISCGMEMSGSPEALNDLLESVRPGATIALLGILPSHAAINWNLVIFKMLTLKGVYGREIFSTWDDMVNLIQAGFNLSPLITHHYSYKEFQKAFETMLNGQCGKVILNWI